MNSSSVSVGVASRLGGDRGEDRVDEADAHERDDAGERDRPDRLGLLQDRAGSDAAWPAGAAGITGTALVSTLTRSPLPRPALRATARGACARSRRRAASSRARRPEPRDRSLRKPFLSISATFGIDFGKALANAAIMRVETSPAPEIALSQTVINDDDWRHRGPTHQRRRAALRRPRAPGPHR